MRSTGRDQRFNGSTRGQIVALLRRASRTVNEMAEALGLTGNAVRSHLSTLERDGIVTQVGVRRGTRKPNNAYDLTPEAESLFPKAYAPVLQQLLEVLGERLPAEEREAVLREVGHRLAAPHLPALQNKTLPERLEAVAGLLGDLGGLAEVEEKEGRQFVRGFSCPLSGAVAGHPEVCLAAETLVGDLVGVPVKECCERSGSPRCCFEVLTDTGPLAPNNGQ